jgi:hypothetical protein
MAFVTVSSSLIPEITGEGLDCPETGTDSSRHGRGRDLVLSTRFNTGHRIQFLMHGRMQRVDVQVLPDPADLNHSDNLIPGSPSDIRDTIAQQVAELATEVLTSADGRQAAIYAVLVAVNRKPRNALDLIDQLILGDICKNEQRLQVAAFRKIIEGAQDYLRGIVGNPVATYLRQLHSHSNCKFAAMRSEIGTFETMREYLQPTCHAQENDPAPGEICIVWERELSASRLRKTTLEPILADLRKLGAGLSHATRGLLAYWLGGTVKRAGQCGNKCESNPVT